MIVVISTADYLLPHTPSFVKVTSAGGKKRLLKKEHLLLQVHSLPAMVRTEHCHRGVILHINIFKIKILGSKLK